MAGGMPPLLYVLYTIFITGTHAIPMSRTLVIVRPESIYEDALIMMEFMRSGFKVKERSLRALDKLSAKQFLAGRFENQASDDLIDAWSDKTMAVYVLERRSAVAMAKAIAGPEDPMVARTAAPHSIRAKHGHTATRNALYCSRTLKEASHDIAYFFHHAHGNSHLEKEHRLMHFDVSSLGSDVFLSSMTWLEQHEREVVGSEEQNGLEQLHLDDAEDMAIEPSLGLHMLSNEYIQGLPDPTRAAIHSRMRALDGVMDHAGGQGVRAVNKVGTADGDFVHAASLHAEL